MSTTTSIEWTEKTWNPVTGCTKVSQGCKNCYAEGVANRFWARQYPKVRYMGTGLHARIEFERPRKFTDVQTHDDRLLEPLSWRKPAKVFVNSMSDLFHEDVPDEFIDRVFAVMALCQQHTFQVLTKRPERMRGYCSSDETLGRMVRLVAEIVHGVEGVKSRYAHKPDRLSGFHLPNVWLGVSCENQQTADERIPLLLQTPAAVRWISAEPLLGPIDIRHYMPNKLWNDLPSWAQDQLDWVVVGGESGPGARHFNLEWARAIVKQCQSASVPVFMKQLGAKPYVQYTVNGGTFTDPMYRELKNRKGGDITEWPADLRLREWPYARV